MSFYSDEIDFISIVIPSFNRFHYLESLIDSIHKNADIPFELIVHDDSSHDGSRDATCQLIGSRISSIILNGGLNLGLSESINRCVGIAGSKYILMLNADLTVEKPIFKDIVNVLKCPFVGSITPFNHGLKNGIGFTSNGTGFFLHNGIGSGCCVAFRKDSFADAGGWDNKTVANSNADVSFMARIIKAGYFSACISMDGVALKNVSYEKCNNGDSTISNIEFGGSLPQLFGIERYDYESMSKRRYNKASDAMQISYREPAGETNIDYWSNYKLSVVDENENVDWELAKLHGQDRWKDILDNYRVK